MLILGGSATVNSLTGMNTLAVRNTSVFHWSYADGNGVGMFPDPARSRHIRRGRRYAGDSPMRLVSLPSFYA